MRSSMHTGTRGIDFDTYKDSIGVTDRVRKRYHV